MLDVENWVLENESGKLLSGNSECLELNERNQVKINRGILTSKYQGNSKETSNPEINGWGEFRDGDKSFRAG